MSKLLSSLSSRGVDVDLADVEFSDNILTLNPLTGVYISVNFDELLRDVIDNPLLRALILEALPDLLEDILDDDDSDDDGDLDDGRGDDADQDP